MGAGASAAADGGGADRGEEDAVKALHSRLDLDFNGHLSLSEIKAFCAANNSLKDNELATKFMTEWDTNRDAKVSPDEFLEMWKKNLADEGKEATEAVFHFFSNVALEAEKNREAELFHRLDLDFNGALDLAELRSFTAGNEALAGKEGAAQFMKLWDQNSDGKVEEAEWVAAWQKDRAEAGVEPTKQALKFMVSVAVEAEQVRERALFKQLDKDNSGALDLPELVAFTTGNKDALGGAAPQLLASWDSNSDGKVSEAEWLSMWEKNKAEEGVEPTKQAYKFFAKVADLAEKTEGTSAENPVVVN